eukprot:5091458-Pyramimonas_sp.AAC.1
MFNNNNNSSNNQFKTVALRARVPLNPYIPNPRYPPSSSSIVTPSGGHIFLTCRVYVMLP